MAHYANELTKEEGDSHPFQSTHCRAGTLAMLVSTVIREAASTSGNYILGYGGLAAHSIN
jgi:hypothetical protein